MTRNLSDELTKVLDSITDSILNGDLAIFFGSGISVYPPSNLPVGSALRRSLFDQLFDAPSLLKIKTQILTDDRLNGARDRILYGYAERTESETDMEYVASHYPFELFIETIHEYTNAVPCLADLFKLGRPNLIHSFIARLIIEGYLWRMMTTNFDEHVENAVKALLPNTANVNGDQVLRVLINEGDFTYLSDKPASILYKIHGTCSNLGSMRTTMNAIASSELTPHRGNAIKRFFEEEKDILILGYSGSDEFDVNRVLKVCNKTSQIYWVRRLKENKNPVESLVHPFTGFNGSMIHIDLEDLMDYLARKIGIIIDTLPPKNEEWLEHISNWGSGLSDGQKVYTVSKLLYEVQLIDEAIELLDGAITQEDLYTDREVAAFHNIRSNIAREQGFYEIAEKISSDGLVISKKTQDKKLYAAQLHARGILVYEQGDFEGAEKLYRQALDIFLELDDIHAIAISFHQLGNLRYYTGRYEEAEQLYLKSLETKRQVGDEREIAGSYHMLGRIRQDLGDYDEAERLFRAGLDISEKLGNLRGISSTLLNLAMVVQEKERLDEAEAMYERCIELYKKLGDQLGVAQAIQNIATLYENRGDLDRAEQLYKDSLSIKERIEDLRGIGFSYQGLGLIEMKRGNWRLAETYLKKTLEIRKKLEDRRGLLIITNMLDELSKRRTD